MLRKVTKLWKMQILQIRGRSTCCNLLFLLFICSDVLAAYASFLWTVDDDEDDKKLDSLSEMVLIGCTGV